MKKTIYFKPSFPPLGSFLSVVATISGIYLLIDAAEDSYYIVGGLLCFVGSFVLTAFEGLIIDASEKKVLKYTTTFGIKKGKWIEVGGYKAISLLSNKVSHNRSVHGVNPTKFTDMLYKVVLLNSNHSKKFVIFESLNLENATAKLTEIQTLLELDKVRYNPPVAKKRK
ncbi:hypothetical protein [Parvicella tangerina]|uniref:Uncharacterized protein n=1 Tax=Parvicella tangerina TaxID=2829795 RepID=A0A916JNL2_9FLAO|nr:hypothetical protein [Parvicella tangerina]CAG5083568.1 hypothetical protein CRYO30217_02232 [Parvicella tangerina]